MIYIRADVNKEIATGHVMRCMAIADKLREQGCDSVFIVADHCGEALINGAGYDTICLDTVWNKMDTETDKLLKLIKDKKIKTLLIDSYFVTKDYLNKIGNAVRVFYIDDLDMFEYPVDTVINYSIYADKFNYKCRYEKLGMKTKFLSGCQYAPLRKEFQDVNYQVREAVTDILITTGGTDNFNIAGELTQVLLKDKKLWNVNINIVVGAYNKNKNFLDALHEHHNNIVLHRNVKEMAKLMTSCDVVVSAGGTTLYELCACGVPTVAVSCADNQLDNVERFAKENLIIYCGDVRNNTEHTMTCVVDKLRGLAEAYQARETLSQNMKSKKIINGAGKIADKLLQK